MSLSLQDKFAPLSKCFGCGPSNALGLHVKTMPIDSEHCEAEWTPQKHHEAFEGMLNGGIIGALMDCHANWAAAWCLMNKKSLTSPPCTVTAEFSVKLLRPTPSTAPLKLTAEVLEVSDTRVKVRATMISGGKTCATLDGTFVEVGPGHPAYHRW